MINRRAQEALYFTAPEAQALHPGLVEPYSFRVGTDKHRAWRLAALSVERAALRTVVGCRPTHP